MSGIRRSKYVLVIAGNYREYCNYVKRHGHDLRDNRYITRPEHLRVFAPSEVPSYM